MESIYEILSKVVCHDSFAHGMVLYTVATLGNQGHELPRIYKTPIEVPARHIIRSILDLGEKAPYQGYFFDSRMTWYSGNLSSTGPSCLCDQEPLDSQAMQVDIATATPGVAHAPLPLRTYASGEGRSGSGMA